MKKVTDLYPPEIARNKLEKHFSGTPEVLELIRTLGKTDLCTFAALCDGHVVTTIGYDIPVDLAVKRASAVALSLKKRHLPIQSKSISAKADVGGAVYQAAFYIDKTDLVNLKAEPSKVMKACEKLLNSKKQTNAQKEMRRLVSEFGEEGVLALLRSVASANDVPTSDGKEAS